MEHDLIQPPLLDEIKKYLNQIKNNEKIHLFVPYIKTKSLEKLIDGINNEIIIVTNWKENNFLTGSAELSLYPFCNEKGIKLYNNEKIHLKVYSINLDSMILATGNISQRGLMPNGNLELGTLIEKISHKDRQFFEQIIQDSQIIDEELYRSREKYLEENPPFKELIEPITVEKDPKDEFLISALPMTRNIAILKNSYDKLNRNMPASNDQEINGCVDADLENYGIPLQLSPDEFEKLLKKKFFEHPFIQRIAQFLTPCGQFGEIKQWIQDNCADVPIPSRRELTGNVQVLLEWFVKLGDGTYEMDVPGAHSQRLCKIIPEEIPTIEILEKQPVQKNDLDANLVLFSVSSSAAYEHFKKTILNDVNTESFPQSQIRQFRNVRMWGSIDRSNKIAHSKWSKLKKGDILLFFRKKKYVAKMILDGTENSSKISKMIWGKKIDHKEMNIDSVSDETWQLIMYGSPKNVEEFDVLDSDLNKLLDYNPKFPGPLGTFDFLVVKEKTLKKLRNQHGSIQKALESIGI